MHHKIKSAWFLIPLTFLILVSLVLGGCGQSASGTITEAGSTTVQPVAEKLAVAFKQKNPDVTITIQGGGSSVGIKSAADGTVDIGAASRELKSDEPKLVTHLLARDGIAVIVHPGNALTVLTKEQLVKIFAGEITNWNQVGGTSGTITVIAREEGSGTRAAFEEMVMGETLITAKAILQPSNGALRTSVSTTPLAIGFISLGYIDNTVKALSIDGISPTEENCKAGKYPVVRPLYFLTKEQPTGLVKQFIDFCLGSEGQAIIEKEGYLSAK
ncbi:MAG: phosphate ABC transporter substrate-binding protein [Dehalococcoidia bacterium]|nr:phosphate ABC transporter substrate-binding protein [Dehalococcoidia bacterium]